METVADQIASYIEAAKFSSETASDVKQLCKLV